MNAIFQIAHFAQIQVARLRMRLAAWWLSYDYKTDPELTVFNALDGEQYS